MPVVTFDKKYLMSLLPSDMTEEELKSQTYKLGFEVERINKEEISIEITPNRPDLYSAVGLARALKNFMHKSKRFVYEIKDETPAFSINVGKEVASVRPFISAIAAYGLDFSNESLAELINFTEKLCETYGRSRKKIAIGLHDLGQIEPPLHYNAYKDEKYMPLNDNQERSFSEILKTTDKGAKYGYTIGGGKRYPALKDNHGVLSFIPILNSERTRVTARTKSMLIDITGMHGDSVNKTADLLGSIFMDMGAEVRKVEINYTGKTIVTPVMGSRYISIPLQMAEGEIGVKIGYNNIISLANKMGYEAALIGKDIKFRIPSYRMDIINDQDVVEDIAIGYGYDYIRPVPILASQKGELEGRELLLEKASEAMVGMGFYEVLNTYLTNEETNFEKMGIKDAAGFLSKKNADYVRLKNAKAQSITMMRTWILPSLLKNIGISTHEKMPQKLFELDMAFHVSKKAPIEEYHLAGVCADPRSNFNNIKSVIDSLSYVLNLPLKVEQYENESFVKGRCARIMLDKEMIGFFGEIHPQVLGNFGIEEPTSAFEINLNPIVTD